MRKYKKPVVLQNVLVEDYAAEGKSLARVDGKVIFIENAVPGDVVDLQLSKNKKDWAEGWPLQVKSYSADRVQPFCAHFGVCGGCQWQMLPYEKQLVYKQKQVYDNLHRIGKVSLPEMMPIAGCEETRYYRNKLEYTFSTKRFVSKEDYKKFKEKQEADALAGLPPQEKTETSDYAAGFHAKGMFDKVVEINTCHLQHEPTNHIRKAIAAYALEHGHSFYDIRQHQGWLRTMQVRLATTGELMVNIVFGYEAPDERKALLDYVLQRFPEITTLLYTINTKKNDSLFDLSPQVYHGKGYIIEKLEDFSFKISPKSFFQTNTRQAEKLYQITREFAALDGTQTVYDLYCGTGSIGIFTSRLAKRIVGVEVVAEAIADAKENAALNNLPHTAFFAGDVVDICDDAFFAQHGKPDVIITDPPRAGMHEKLVNKLLEIAAPLIVYVSCNPATQARDLALLGEKYSVEKIQPVDMFPHTHHIENVVQLKLKP
ncbi:23S rRNA (uracil(1939)-C(5))-methyltransferase RlmD [Deminuibacter soli]|uniref:23S rRNA (Uracil(1939)-C(5))-methyltransferase RlmD n=1 Tax=Deminuibacter soli TaxID=2291815 RepID=A0A3E1NQM2_9BACT|nr:23S rRNA (uracil(1939)-C(5))-methyltransferase RlmD [Deminuibacter soli]RFM30221.1 23S rRNA (uracil(1939)-C(5))-methyltransferase RlmD [Deminuibacter soli]